MIRLGRTNTEFPAAWAALRVDPQTTPEALVTAVRELHVPIDISSQPALWGGFLRGGTDVLVQKSTIQYERATSQDHSTDLLQAHLIETLSSIGREMVDFYFLRVRRAVEEYQLNGALAALEFAKQEGHIRFLGIAAEGHAIAVQSVWQFHDAFDVLYAPSEGADPLISLAAQRRVGVVMSGSGDLSRGIVGLRPVGTLQDVESLRDALLVRP